MSDPNNVLAVLAAALAPYLAQHLGAASAGGNPTTQAGGTFGSPQTAGAPNTAFDGSGTAGQLGGGVNTQQTAAPANTGGMFGTTGGTVQQQAQPTVTADMVQQLVTPLVQVEQVKAACIKQMTEMGIQNLPDARPDQLGELYARFQEVDRQAREAGLIGGQQQAAPSLI